MGMIQANASMTRLKFGHYSHFVVNLSCVG